MAAQVDVPPEFRGYFTTGVAGITSLGPLGPNIMAAEWTYHISYDPPLIAVLVHPEDATHANIEQTREFGVNLFAADQGAPASAAGNHSQHDVNKLPNDLFPTYPAKYIRPPLVRGCILNAECRLVQQFRPGDHTIFVGEVVAATYDTTKPPLLLHGATGYHTLSAALERRPLVYVFAGFRRNGDAPVLNVQGRVYGGQANAPVQLRVEDNRGTIVREGTPLLGSRGHFTWRALGRGWAPGAYRVSATFGELRAQANVELATSAGQPER